MGSCGAGVASASVTRFFLKPSALPRALSHPRLLLFPFEHHQRLQFRSRGQILVHNAHKTFYYSQKGEEEIHATGEELTFLEQESRTCLQSLKESLVLIDLIQRLGIDYKFTEHIEKILETAFIWWEENGVEVLPFNRGNTLKSVFLVSATMFQPRFSTYRVAFTKNATLIILMDDLFDYPASDYEGLSRFIEAVRRWDPSLVNDLPEHKLVFAAVQSTVEDIATVSSNEQGRDLLPYFKTLWEDIVTWYSKEAEWKKRQYFPTLEEYLENGKCSIGVITCYCTSMFLLGVPITDEIIQHVGGGSRLLRLVGLVSRVANDIVTYRREVLRGETVSSVSCYMRDNLGCSEEEAIYSLSQMIENAWLEIEWELFSCRNVVPESCHHAMLSLARMYAFSYKSIDAFTENSDTEFEFHYRDYLYGSLG